MATVPVKHKLAVLLLWLQVWLSDTKHTGLSMDDDLLLPYAQGHGPAHSHRYVRECQPVVHGNVTYETKMASNHTTVPVAKSSVFVTDVPGAAGRRWVYGHLTVVQDPLRSVSVLEPGGTGGCGSNMRAAVEETAQVGACLYAQNAGFFRPENGQCLGNVVSDGRLVRDSGGVQNAQFGIRKDGSLVFGYLSQDDVLEGDNPFVQLVSGVIWLLRDGQVYINESLKVECKETQETGALRYFVDVISARTAVGHDADGNLILFHIDGQTDVRGMNLWEVAEFLRANGVVNAINLDGGGSSTFTVNGSLASYPSDHCESDTRWRCPRHVSTILCVHDRRCQPEDCSGHGVCVNGRCQCEPGWRGPACDSSVCRQPGCGGRGVCTANGCVCEAGWRGENCSEVCMSGFHGDGCNQTCSCANGGRCDPIYGNCTCPPGFHGDSCQQVCPLGLYGQACGQECRCQDMCPCDPITGSCNASVLGERNYTLHRAGHCLAQQMFKTWRQEEEPLVDKPYLAERSWLVITVVLFLLLLASVVAHLTAACRQPASRPHRFQRNDYSYVPLNDINGDLLHGRDVEEKPRTSRKLDFEDSDSQEEIWSPPQ